jgi:hypothetical protein
MLMTDRPSLLSSAARRPPRRAVWLVVGDDPLMCSPDPADGHPLRDPLVWNDGALRCKHKDKKSVGECGRLIYLVGGGLVTTGSRPLVIVTRVSPEEMRYMREQRMDHDRALQYLGITLSPPL